MHGIQHLMTRTIKEWCPKCDAIVGEIAVADEQGEDCQFFDQLKELKRIQKSASPKRCGCGAVVRPLEA